VNLYNARHLRRQERMFNDDTRKAAMPARDAICTLDNSSAVKMSAGVVVRQGDHSLFFCSFKTGVVDHKALVRKT